jgi:hypothetical protein
MSIFNLKPIGDSAHFELSGGGRFPSISSGGL